MVELTLTVAVYSSGTEESLRIVLDGDICMWPVLTVLIPALGGSWAQRCRSCPRGGAAPGLGNGHLLLASLHMPGSGLDLLRQTAFQPINLVSLEQE